MEYKKGEYYWIWVSKYNDWEVCRAFPVYDFGGVICGWVFLRVGIEKETWHAADILHSIHIPTPPNPFLPQIIDYS